MLVDPRWETLEAEEKALLDLSTPSLEGLAYILRHKEWWPIGFEWNYGSCNKCAMGMAARLWGQRMYTHVIGVDEHIYVMSCLFREANSSERYSIFMESHINFKENKETCLMSEVTPEMVADRINEILAQRKEGDAS